MVWIGEVKQLYGPAVFDNKGNPYPVGWAIWHNPYVSAFQFGRKATHLSRAEQNEIYGDKKGYKKCSPRVQTSASGRLLAAPVGRSAAAIELRATVL
jgi:hypothetical protein